MSFEVPDDATWAKPRTEPRETLRAFGYFCVYRDMGPTRSIKAAAATIGIAYQTAQDHASRHSWAMRADAFDAWLERAKLDSWLSEQDQMVRAELSISRAMMGVVGRAVRSLDAAERVRETALRRMNDGELPYDPDVVRPIMRPADIPRMLEAAVKVGRLARGEATENINANLTVTSMSDNELRREIEAALADSPEAKDALVGMLDTVGEVPLDMTVPDTPESA